ncbi:MAG TPA: PEGA domain-containing protein [Verrucomicrobiae bacterium]|nr:PEGA domain-containing protein [Verrucomicrobiae bacterium]
MKNALFFATGLTAVMLLAGCETVPPGVERGPQGTIAYDVFIEASPPGARIEANGEVVGNTPLHLKIFGDKDGTFHDFGSYYYVIRALPLTTNQFVQTRAFRTGRWFTPEDYVPGHIYFDMNTPPPPAPAYPTPPPAYYYPPPAYYYGPPYYYGPGFRFYFGGRHW